MPTPLVKYRINASTFATIQNDLGQVEAETRYIKKTGGGLTGPLTVLAGSAGTHVATKAYVDSRGMPPGVCIPWGGEYQSAPPGWLPCGWGNQVSRYDYPALYNAISTYYGGDGNPYFTLPVIQARVPVGYDGGTFNGLGQMTGNPAEGLAASQVPNMAGSFEMHNTAGPTVLYTGDGVFSGYNGSATLYHSHENPIGGPWSFGGVTWSNQGGGNAHENRQPYIIFQFIIKY
jgi:microcystin-dependent protein